MGRTEKGPMGSATGKIGPLVYYQWRGIDCVRTRPRVNKRRKVSDKEAKNRSKFAYVQNFLSTITPFLKHGFHNYNENQSAYNSAMSHTLKNAVSISEDGGFYINHPNLRISKGIESPLTEINLTVKDNTLICTWDYDQAIVNELEAWEFRSILLIIPEDPSKSIDGVIISNTLSSKEEQIVLNYSNKKENYHVHIAFVCVDHSDRRFDSIYAGTFSI